MIAVALADIHGDTSRLVEMADDLAGADVVLLVGDITDFGRRQEIRTVVDAVRGCNERILAVPGNCDYPEVADYLSEEGINLHRTWCEVEGVAFVGLGGSLPCPGQTPVEYSDAELGVFLHEATTGLAAEMPMVLVTHEPPYGTDVDKAYTGEHVGSEAVRRFIE
ncbi:MAG: metallophosphoesterase, partial [Candidatus Latescibacteria bacterium]|nr:metallophosphoesterase [Candidatus Latescibacterota bacterium]